MSVFEKSVSEESAFEESASNKTKPVTVISSRLNSTAGEFPSLLWLYAFWKFSRPHTIVGTLVSAIGLYLMALAAVSPAIWGGLFLFVGAVAACLCGNVYIVGLNQLEDVEIDRINKPHLPLASGEFSRRQGQWIVAISGILAVLLAGSQGPFLLGTVGISLAIGTAYSLPPIRLKRSPFWASFCIFTVRGGVVNLGLFSHFQWGLCRSAGDCADGIPFQVWLLTLFIVGFTFAIAIFKDIPDLEGDRQYNISTFTVRLGAPAVLKLSRWVLAICYLALILVGAFQTSIQPAALILTHLAALGLFWWRSWRLNLADRSAIANCYQFIWKLFYLEYLIFPLACLATRF